MITDAELSSMRAAIEELLPDTCDILSVIRTPDGQGGWSETWGTATAGVACRLDYAQGRPVYTGGAIQAYTGYMMTLPYNTGVTGSNRLLHDGNTYTISGLDTGKSWQLDIRCRVERVE